jgi:hypothetical protein
MKKMLIIFSFAIAINGNAQPPARNIIIITTDGFRWQEIFKGMDSVIANNSKFNQSDSEYIFKTYWDIDELERRKKLMPFLWSTVVSQGQLFGNRTKGNKIDNANPYWFSYPGYNEIMTGYADTSINSNNYMPNPNITVLEYLNKQPQLKGKVAAFGAWEAFNIIFNEDRCGFPVVAGYDAAGGKTPNANEKLINKMNKDSFRPFGEEECLDVFTHYAAMEYLKNKKPKVLYIAYGETDEWAHSGHYRSYLDAAHQVDAWIKEIWNFVQGDPQYRNNTSLIITTDHGRGDLVKDEWTSHNNKIQDSHEMWLAVMGPDIEGKGELKTTMQLYQKQIAQTAAKLMGHIYKANHPVAEEIQAIFKIKK